MRGISGDSDADEKNSMSAPSGDIGASIIIVSETIVKNAAGIGLEFGLVDGAVCVVSICNLANGSTPDHVHENLFWPGDHVIKINDTAIDDLDIDAADWDAQDAYARSRRPASGSCDRGRVHGF